MSSFITPIITRFTAELESAVENALVDIESILRGATASVGAGGAKPNAGTKPAKPRAGGPRKGRKRTPEELEALTEKVFELIKHHPGERIEKLSARSNFLTKEMNLPIKKLIAAKRIVTSGEKRATTYSVRGAK